MHPTRHKGIHVVQYRRDFTPGASYFFTVTLQDRHSSFLTQHIRLLGNAFRHARQHAPFITHAIVVLPEHLHVIWQLPIEDSNFSLRWRLIKTHFTHSLIKSGKCISKNKRGEYHLWQRRFWEHRIRNERDLTAHVDYIHYNPVKHGLVKQASDWQYSSIHRYISQGILPVNWGGKSAFPGEFGEAG